MLQTVSGVTLEWDPSPDAWVAGYAIHHGTASGHYTVRVDVGNQTSVTLSNLTPGVTYYFVATAYAADGQESLPSNEVAYTVPDGTPGGPTNQAPQVSAGADQAITLPATATLAATVSDDGLPATPGSVSVQWTVLAGPGIATFANASIAATTVSFSQAGNYVLKLTATDGELTAADELAVTVSPANTAPVVSAGPDQAITLPATATLAATLADDGLPATPGSVSVSWSMVSGPDTATFADASAAATSVSFSQAGSYVLKVTATDGELSASDELAVTVSPANTAPVVSAGPDQTITLPATATLAATVSDDGLPTTLVSLPVTWSMVSGPGTATFANASAAATSVSFSQAGSYVLKVTATDSELSASDELAVTVSPANTAPVVSAGPDQAITLPASATLTATIADDGLPTTPGAVGLHWEVIAGPGEVVFENPTATAATASFPTAGLYEIRVTATDGELESSDELTVVVTQPSPTNPVGLLIEAETGWVSEPMLVMTNSCPVGTSETAYYISTLTAGQGTASYGFDVQEAGEYYVWARVLAGDTADNSFYVSGDGTLAGVLSADAAASGTNTWHWVRLTVGTGHPGGNEPRYSTHPSQPSSVTFDPGAHQLTIRGGGAGVSLDKFIVTNDPNFVPVEAVGVPTVPRILDMAISATGARLTWNTVAGTAYRLVYKDNLSDSQWLPASPDVLAFGDKLSWFDETAGAASRRFYSILAVH